MTRVTGFLTQKGGVGKTTLALNISATLAAMGYSVLYVDADEQHTGTDWNSTRDTAAPFAVVAMPSDTLHRDLPRIKGQFDHVVVDGAPHLEARTRSAIAASDVVIIPVQPSGPDIWAAAPAVKMIEAAQMTKPELKAAFVINRLKPATSLGKQVLGVLEGQPLPTLPTFIHDRVIYAEAITSGQTIHEAQPKGKAAQELELLAAAIIELHSGHDFSIAPDKIKSTLERVAQHLTTIRGSDDEQKAAIQAAE